MSPRGALEPAPDAPTRVGPFGVVGRLAETNVLVGIDDGGRRAAIHLLSDADVEAARQRNPEITPRRSVARLLSCELDGRRPFAAMELVTGIDLASAVAQHGARSRVEVAGIATALAEHLVALHRAGCVDGRLGPEHVLLTPTGPYVIEPVGGADDADPTGDVLAWGEILHLAAVGRPPAPERSAEPDDLQDLDLSIADLIIGSTRPNAQERPSAETILKVLLGGRLPPQPSGAVEAVIARTWKLAPELRRDLQPGDVEPARRRPAGEVLAQGARTTRRGIAALVLAAVAVIAFAYVALRVAVR